MIEWMQRHKKWLVITIWVSAIAFIAAEMVGWGQYDYSLGQDSVAKVGKIHISKTEFAQSYSNAFEEQYQQSNGRFDEEQAKAIGLKQEVLNGLILNALLRNYAIDLGLRVSDEEVAHEIRSGDRFHFLQDENHNFSRQKYDSFLQNIGYKTSDFEEMIKNELLTKKILQLLIPQITATPLEKDTFSAIFGIQDNIELDVISSDSIQINTPEDKLKAFWEEKKQNYKTPVIYKVEALITKTADQQYSQEELQSYYEANKSHYLDTQAQIQPLDQIKQQVISDLQHKKASDQALRDFKELKKDIAKNTQELSISQDSTQYTQEILEALQSAVAGSMLKKPMPLHNDFISLKLISKQEATIKDFQEVKQEITQEFIAKERQTQLNQLAQSRLSTFKGKPISNVAIINPTSFGNFDPYTSQMLLEAIFTSTKNVNYGIIGDKAFLFRIVSQSIVPFTQEIYLRSIGQIKSSSFAKLVFDYLQKRYEVKKYI